jgi:hypothetical protein
LIQLGGQLEHVMTVEKVDVETSCCKLVRCGALHGVALTSGRGVRFTDTQRKRERERERKSESEREREREGADVSERGESKRFFQTQTRPVILTSTVLEYQGNLLVQL